MEMKNVVLAKLEFKHIQQQLVGLRAQVRILNAEACITDQTHKMLDHTLQNLIDFVDKLYSEESL